MSRLTGTVKWFNDEKGYGFIAPDEGGDDLFVHASALPPMTRSLNEGDRVEYEITDGKKGKQADKVSLEGEAPASDDADYDDEDEDMDDDE